MRMNIMGVFVGIAGFCFFPYLLRGMPFHSLAGVREKCFDKGTTAESLR